MWIVDISSSAFSTDQTPEQPLLCATRRLIETDAQIEWIELLEAENGSSYWK